MDFGKKKLKLYSPWVIFVKQLKALFEKDPDIEVTFDENKKLVSVYVDNEAKAEALARRLPVQKVFGNVVLSIEVIPSNNKFNSAADFEAIFDGNEAFDHFTTISEIPDAYISNPISYCVFKKEVVQYGADDLSSESGKASTLYQDLAKEIFGETEGVYFCTI